MGRVRGIEGSLAAGEDLIGVAVVDVAGGEPFELLCLLRPCLGTWQPKYTLEFDYELLRWECVNSRVNSETVVLKQTLAALIPFGGLVNALGSLAVDHTVKQMGMARLEGWDGLTERGVTMKKGWAELDLEAQPELAPLWTDPLEARPLLQAAARHLQQPRCAADLFKLSGVRADREGIHLKAEFTKAGKMLFEASAGTARSLRAGGAASAALPSGGS